LTVHLLLRCTDQARLYGKNHNAMLDCQRPMRAP